MKYTITLLLVLTMLAPAAATGGLLPKIEIGASAGVIGAEAFSDSYGLRATAAFEVTPSLAIGAAYERLGGEYLINSPFFLLERSRRYDIISAFVSARLMEREAFSLWHGLSCGTLTDESTTEWSAYAEADELEIIPRTFKADGQSVMLDTWLRATTPVSDRLNVSGAIGVRFCGIGDLDGAEERALEMFRIPYEDNVSASQGRVYFRVGVEARF